MRLALRVLAVLIALGGVVDPSFTYSPAARLPIEVVVPPSSHPDHARARALKDNVLRQVEDFGRVDGSEDPKARIAIGSQTVPVDPSIPVVPLSLPPASVEIQQMRVPDCSVPGQQIDVEARVRGQGLQGKSSHVLLKGGQVPMATARLDWSRKDETQSIRFAVPGQRAGVHRLRLDVATDGAAVFADALATVCARPLRVLVYEPRPTWTVTFVRRSLEADGQLELSALARSAPRVTTTVDTDREVLTTARVNTFDALVVGALDALTARERRVIRAFVTERGGAVILLPDAKVPEPVRTEFDLPRFEEVLLEEAVGLESDGPKMKASELLLPSESLRGEVIGTIRRNGTARPVVFAAPLGAGTIIFSGALDAWRYRSADGQDLSTFVRTVVTDAAGTAPAAIELAVDPSIGRPGEPVTVRATIRQTEFIREGLELRTRPLTAAVTRADGQQERLRLWPTSRVGEFSGTFRPSGEGHYQVSAAAGDTSADEIFVAAADVLHPARAGDRAGTVASLTGGAVVDDLDGLRDSLRSLHGTRAQTRVYPMRSGWWILPFAGLLTAEWVLRRRTGDR